MYKDPRFDLMYHPRSSVNPNGSKLFQNQRQKTNLELDQTQQALNTIKNTMVLCLNMKCPHGLIFQHFLQPTAYLEEVHHSQAQFQPELPVS